jgi:hypothetical protein
MQEIQDAQGSQGLVVIQTTTSVNARNRLRTFAAAGVRRGCQKCLGIRGPTALLGSAIVVDHQTWIEPGKGASMGQRYEYKFVRLGEYGGSAIFGVSDKVRNAYEDVVHQHARDGWRLVQIFAPGVAAFGAAKYYELIFERQRAKDATAPIGAGREHVASTPRA